jgi:predicted  nucleic acid-binding Zn-ribbon protein
MSDTFKLFRLQQVDTKLDQARKRVAAIDRLLSSNQALRQAEMELEKSSLTFENARKDLTSAEANTRAQRLKIEQTDNRLYSGAVKNPKELQDLQMESEALRRYLDVLEERQLEAMLTFEDAESEKSTSETKLATVRGKVLEEQSTLNGERSQLSKSIENLEVERAAAVSTIDPEALALYERLRDQRSGIAVAAAKDKSCAACGSLLSSSLHQAARSRLATCDTCGRILYAG